jgi:hypothetical protein
VHVVSRSIEKIAEQANLIKHKTDITNNSELEALITSIDALTN